MSIQNPVTAEQVLCPINDTAAAPSIQFGGPTNQNSGTGIRGDINSITFSVLGSDVLTINSSGVAGGTILALTSNASAGGAASEAMVVPGLLTTDTVIAVTQKTPGAAVLPLLGYSTQATNALTVRWSADPGAGAVITVAIKR